MKVKTLTIKDLRVKKSADIEKYLTELRKSSVELQHQIAINKENKTHQLAVIKKAIAQAKTIQSELVNGEEK